MSESPQAQSVPRRIRWWPAMLICLLAVAGVIRMGLLPDLPYQQRNIETARVVLVSILLLGIWWMFFSRVGLRTRFLGAGLFVAVLLAGAGLFRIRGVSGDLLPIVEFRWKQNVPAKPELVANGLRAIDALPTTNGASFPQFLGPNRDGVLPGPHLETNWSTHPPQILWRQKVGAAWSGFAVVGEIAVTQEQRGAEECVVAYRLKTGRQLWQYKVPAHFDTTIAGEGPRATPTVAGNRVFALGATGFLSCLDLATGGTNWLADVLAITGGKLPDWGFASAPLVVDGLVMVHGGEGAKDSLHAFRVEDGSLAWSAGETRPGYASPIFAKLAGDPQVLAFNHELITAHDPRSGALLWSRPWGNGNVVCSSPVIVNSNRVLFSSGYGYGAELLEVTNQGGQFSATRLWKSPRLKSKFGHLFVRDGCAMGLDDGVFAAVDLADGSLRWKEGRYGHGQGLLVGELYLLMAESGELVLLRPTRDVPHELARFRVFNAKTWNPLALAGDFLLVRNDQEAACLRLPTVASAK